MKKNLMKKMTAFTAAVLMTSAIGLSAVTAFADNGVTVVTQDKTASQTISIEKDIVIYNPDGATVYVPTITYYYNVAAATVSANDTITDNEGNTVKVKAGVTDGVTLGTDSTAEFPKGTETTVTASATGTVLTDTFNLVIDPTKFTAAGVYRYIITEDTGTERLTAVGMTRSSNDYVSTRTLDVYIEDNNGARGVVGYVLSVGNDTTTINGEDNDPATTITGKTTGFVQDYIDKTVDPELDGTLDTGKDPKTDLKLADEYYTYNYEVTKFITGNLSDKTETFPFTVTVKGNNGQKFTADGQEAAIASGEKVIKKPLGNNESIELIGIPANASIAVEESNPNLGTYTVSLTEADGITAPALVYSDTTANKLTPGSTASFAEKKISAYENAATPANALLDKQNLKDTTFTNDLQTISPTGVVLMAAPYAIMLGAAVFFIVFSLRRRRDDEAKNTI